jgi:CheY-like chemotaxis protein
MATVQNPHSPILLVDDDPLTHKLIVKYLKDWDVESVYSGKEALEALASRNFVIVITDLKMPGMSGIELLKEIKATYSHRVQVIVITVSDEMKDFLNALHGGANDFLLKPFKKKDLVEVLDHTQSRLNRWKRTMASLLERKTSE